MGVYRALSSALHFCPDGYIGGSTWNAATRHECVSQSADRMFAVNSWTWNFWKRFHALASLPLTVPYIALQWSRPVVTGSWTKSPMNNMDIPPNGLSGSYIDWSHVSRRTMKLVLNMDTSSTTTILSRFPYQLQLLYLNLASKSWTHCEMYVLVANDWHQHWLDICNGRFHP